MWASKSLSVRWLSRCDDWSNPCLQVAASPTSHDDVIPQPSDPNRVLEWHWRIDVLFGAWAYRALQRAEHLGARVEEGVQRRFRMILAYLDELEAGSSQRVIQRAAQGPVELPGAAMVSVLVGHARLGLCPRWAGWEKQAAIEESRETERAKQVQATVAAPQQASRTPAAPAVSVGKPVAGGPRLF